ncbi:MAG: hypothetical protein ACHQ51_02290 [Elusimicrobiota bacterium]
MMRSLAAVLLLGVAACSRPAPVPGGASLQYAAPDGSFTALLPGGWKVDDAPGENRKAAFFGPPDGAKPFAQLIAVSFYPAGGRYKDVNDYIGAQSALGQAQPPREVAVGAARGAEVIVKTVFSDIHAGPQPLVTRVLAFPSGAGFYALEHTWPDGEAPSPAFDALVSSFKARAK